MRRPLFAAAVFLVMIAAIRLKTGWAEEVPDGCISTDQLDTGRELLIAGQVYQKNETSVYLRSVVLATSNAFGQSAAGLQQENPIQENSMLCENIICETEEARRIPLGSFLAVRGEFSAYSHATNPGEFDAAVYYRTLEVGGKLRKAVVLSRGEEYWHVREWLYGLKCYFKERLYQIFPEKEAAVMSALLLGDKSELDGDLKELYKRNGVLHILSISSLHITIIGMSIYRMLRKTGLPIAPCALAGSVILILYGCMTGFSVSACRAIGMYLIKMAAEVVGRTYDMLTALGVMGALMVLRNPFYLHSSGFLLSFTSVLGIGVVYPALEPPMLSGQGSTENASKRKGAKGSGIGDWVRDLPAAAAVSGRKMGKSLAQSFFASLSITLTTLPVQLWFYYEIPVYSVFLNLFVIPFLKPMMITGLLAMLVPGLGGLGIVGRMILGSYEFMCGCFDGLPFHTWNPGAPGTVQIVIYYLLLCGAVGIPMAVRHGDESNQIKASKEAKGCGLKRAAGTGGAGDRPGKSGIKRPGSELSKMKIAATVGSPALLTLAVLLFAIRPPAENSVTFLDVGQGDGILLRTASGQVYIFDFGSSSRKNIGKYILIPCLKYNGIHTVDAVFLSHPDADHVNGAVELLEMAGDENITVNQLLLPDIEEGAKQEQLGKLLEAAAGTSREEAVPVGYLSAGDSWECGSAAFTCLHPEKGFSGAEANAYSECFLVEFAEGRTGERQKGKTGGQGWTLLLTGDVQEKGEAAFFREIQERGISGITVLKAAHHGSRNSTPEELLEQLKPLLTVISSGRNNRYGHPHPELLERVEASGSVIVQTALSGAVTVSWQDGGLEVSGMAE